MTASRYAWATYCDEVRQELGGKQSIMGVYQSLLLVKEFPVVLPKFTIVVSALTLRSLPFKSLTFLVLKDDEVIGEHQLPLAELEMAQGNINLSHESDNEEKHFFIATGVMVFSPFIIDKPATLRTRAITESEELRAQALVISSFDQATKSPVLQDSRGESELAV